MRYNTSLREDDFHIHNAQSVSQGYGSALIKGLSGQGGQRSGLYGSATQSNLHGEVAELIYDKTAEHIS